MTPLNERVLALLLVSKRPALWIKCDSKGSLLVRKKRPNGSLIGWQRVQLYPSICSGATGKPWLMVTSETGRVESVIYPASTPRSVMFALRQAANRIRTRYRAAHRKS